MPVSSVMTALATCLCAEIQEAGLTPPCFCGVVPGQTTIQEYVGDCDTHDGMAWVRLANAYPAVGVGIAAETPGSCGASLGFDVEVGVARAYPIQEEALSEAQTLASTEGQVAAMMAARKAILCCSAYGGKDFILGQWTPIGPLGGLVGGSWTVHLLL